MDVGDSIAVVQKSSDHHIHRNFFFKCLFAMPTDVLHRDSLVYINTTTQEREQIIQHVLPQSILPGIEFADIVFTESQNLAEVYVGRSDIMCLRDV